MSDEKVDEAKLKEIEVWAATPIEVGLPREVLERSLIRSDGYLAELCAALRRERAEVARLVGLIDTPHTDDFLSALKLDAAHQIKRWGVEHDRGKNPEDWFWLLGYLAGKCLRAVSDYARTGDADALEKAKHHTISTAAVMLNWFRRLTGDDLTFQPGADDVAGRDED